jgi:urea carboxylase system permease
MDQPESGDTQDLAALGYKQELKRTIGSFSSFAAGFSYLSILTGMFQTFYLGFDFGGPAFFWTWPAVFCGQLLVALCFAELAASYPLAGSVYQWSKYAGSRAVGWMTGWVYLASYIVSLAAVAIALQNTLPQIVPWTQLIGDGTNTTDRAKNAVLLGCLLILLTTVINAAGVNLMAKINNVGVLTELFGAVVLIVLLAAVALAAGRGPEVLFETGGRGAGQEFGYLAPFLAAALMASFVMYGYDTAGALAEETLQPRKKVPRAILQALCASAVLGALLLATALMAAPDDVLNAPNLRRDDGGLPYLVHHTLAEPFGTLFLANVVFAISVCALAVHAGAVRLIFAMGRDDTLPCSAALSRVYGVSRTPVVGVVVVGVLAALILLANINFPQIVTAVLYIAIVWANLAYLLVTAPLLVRRLRGTWPEPGHAGFSLGRWGLLVNVLAVVWGLVIVVNTGWPRAAVYGEEWYQQYAAPLFTGGLILVSVVYYFAVQRHKDGILPEHRAMAARSRTPPPNGAVLQSVSETDAPISS